MDMKTINLNSTDKWVIDFYPESGVYKNTDNNGDVDVVIVNKDTFFVYLYSELIYSKVREFVYEEVKSTKSDETPKHTEKIELNKQNTIEVTEDFLLRLAGLKL